MSIVTRIHECAPVRNHVQACSYKVHYYSSFLPSDHAGVVCQIEAECVRVVPAGIDFTVSMRLDNAQLKCQNNTVRLC